MSDAWPKDPFKHLVPGAGYVVVRAFRDFERREHLPGETWTFLGSSFLPYHDGLSLFVTTDGQRHQIRMQWREEEQGPVIDRLQDYVQARKQAVP